MEVPARTVSDNRRIPSGLGPHAINMAGRRFA
jgi:hypothetical protein